MIDGGQPVIRHKSTHKHPVPMKPITLAFVLCAAAKTFTSSLHAEELTLKPLEPIVSELTKGGNPDLNELAYVSARGAALFMALSTYIEANPRSDGTDKPIVKNLHEKGMAYFGVAVVIGRMFSKTEDATAAQIQLLAETYTKMIVKSKQLNNEIASPAIKKDVEALKLIEAVVMGLATDFDKKSRTTQQKQGK